MWSLGLWRLAGLRRTRWYPHAAATAPHAAQLGAEKPAARVLARLRDLADEPREVERFPPDDNFVDHTAGAQGPAGIAYFHPLGSGGVNPVRK